MRRASGFALAVGACALGACFFPDLSNLGAGDAAGDAAGDVLGDAPTWQPTPGDVHVYSASIAGVVSMRVWSHASATWASPTAVGSFPNEIVPWVEPAIAGTSEVVALSSWAGSAGSSASLHVLEQPTLAPVVSGPQAIPGSEGAHRAFDVAYESASGDGLVVFSDGTANPRFATRAAGAWSAPAPVFPTLPSGTAVDWIQLAASPTSDEIALVYSDASQFLHAVTWDGSAWMATAPTTLDGSGINVADFAAFVAAYESVSGDLLVAWARPSSCSGAVDPLHFTTKPPGSNVFAAAQTTLSNIASPGPMAAASEPGTDRIAISMLEWCSDVNIQQTGQNDFSAATWDGSSFVAVDDVDSTPGNDYTIHVGATPVGAAWAGGTALAVYSASSTLHFATWSGGSWSGGSKSLAPSIPVATSFALLELPTNDVMMLLEDQNQSLWAKRWDGASFSDMNGGASIADGLYVTSGRPFGALVVP